MRTWIHLRKMQKARLMKRMKRRRRMISLFFSTSVGNRKRKGAMHFHQEPEERVVGQTFPENLNKADRDQPVFIVKYTYIYSYINGFKLSKSIAMQDEM
jgi:hypothetical protein